METLEVLWRGPYPWPKPGRQQRIGDLEAGGVYLFSVERDAAYLVYCAGHTKHFRKRFRQHDRLYRNGTYTIFDLHAFAEGRREKVWPGFWMKRRSTSAEEELARRRDEIAAAVERWLSGYRIFVAPMGCPARLRARLEAALMMALYAADPPMCDVPDRGMSLSPRWASEAPVRVRSITPVTILGVPTELEV